MSRNIFDGGKASEKYSITKDSIKLQELNLNKIEQTVLLNSIQTYLDVYSNQSVTRLRKRSLLRFKENVEATELKLEAGTVTPTVLAEAKSKLAKAKYELILAKGNLNNSISKFKSITKFKVVPNKLPLPNFSFIAPSSKEEAPKTI